MRDRDNHGLLGASFIAVAMILCSGMLMLTMWIGYLAMSGLLEWML